MTERITFSGTDYEVKDFSEGIEWAKQELAGLRGDAQSEGKMGEIAESIIPQFQAAVDWAESQTPDGIFAKWREIAIRVDKARSEGLGELEVGGIVANEFNDSFKHIRVLLRNMSGPHKILGQKVSAYSITQNDR